MSLTRRLVATLAVLVAAGWSSGVVHAQSTGSAAAVAPAEAAPADAAAPEASAAKPPVPAMVVSTQNGSASAGQDTGALTAAEKGGKEAWLEQIYSWGMWPLWACSIALVALVLERRKALRAERVIDPAVVLRVTDLVGELKIEEAEKEAEKSSTVLGQAWARGLHEFHLGGMTMAEALTNSTALAFKPLKRNLQGIATLGVISPLFGLLGTILGMIVIFGEIANSGGADKAKLAGGMGLALFTTAGGLLVAIPAILCNRYFTSRLTNLAEQAELAINQVNYRHVHAVVQSEQSVQGHRPAGAAKAIAGK